jgi:hypothetical protein
MNRRHFAAATLATPASLLLSACAHTGKDVRVIQPPTQALSTFDVVFPIDFKLGVRNEHQLDRFKSSEFSRRFIALTNEFLAHNGVTGSAATDTSALRRERYKVLIEPAGVVFFHEKINAIMHDIALISPTGVSLVEWSYQTNLGAAGFNPEKWETFDTAIAFLILSCLNTLQSVGYAQLRFRPPQTMAGSTNPFVGRIR